MFYFLISCAILANVSANLLLKYGTGGEFSSFQRQLLQPTFWLALVFWGANMLFYSRAVHYRSIPVCYAILVGFTIILLALFGAFLGDLLSLRKWIALGLVALGVALLI